MDLFVVSGFAVEKDKYGKILRIDSISHGVYTNQERAEEIANKVGGTVVPAVQDKESRSLVESWLNPGYMK